MHLCQRTGAWLIYGGHHCLLPQTQHKLSSGCLQHGRLQATQENSKETKETVLSWLGFAPVSRGWPVSVTEPVCGCRAAASKEGCGVTSQKLRPVPAAARGSGSWCATPLRRSVIPAGALSRSRPWAAAGRGRCTARLPCAGASWLPRRRGGSNAPPLHSLRFTHSRLNDNHQTVLPTSLCLTNVCLCLSLPPHLARVQCGRRAPPHERDFQGSGPGNLSEASPHSWVLWLPPRTHHIHTLPTWASPNSSEILVSSLLAHATKVGLLGGELLYTTERLFPLAVSSNLAVSLSSESLVGLLHRDFLCFSF